MEVADKWRPCLATDANCVNPEVPPPPGGMPIPGSTRTSISSASRTPRQSQPYTGEAEDEMTPDPIDTEYEDEDEQEGSVVSSKLIPCKSTF